MHIFIKNKKLHFFYRVFKKYKNEDRN
jgi:hypothetical protein